MMHTYRSLPMTNAVTFPAIQLWLNCPLLLSARYKKVPNQYFQLSFPQVKSSSCINHENQIKILWQKGHISSSWWGTTAWWVGFSLGPCLLLHSRPFLTPTMQCHCQAGFAQSLQWLSLKTFYHQINVESASNTSAYNIGHVCAPLVTSSKLSSSYCLWTLSFVGCATKFLG